MDQPPKKLTIELDDNDVKEDTKKILASMDRIRAETIYNNGCDDLQKDEYLHLTYRLASTIEGLSVENTTKKLENIVKAIDKDERLIYYDYMQDNYWKKHNPKLNKSLDQFVISTLGDDFNSLEDKHHFLQAVKFIGVLEANDEQKEKIYNTILPYNGKVKNYKQGMFSSLLGKIFGYSYKIKEDNDLTLRVNGNPDFIEDLMEEARDLGYYSLQMDMYNDDFENLKTKIPNAQVINTLNRKNKFYNTDSFRSFVRGLIRGTVPISYPLLGSLPASLQERLQNYTTEERSENTGGRRVRLIDAPNLGYYNARYATNSSILTEGIASLSTAISSGIVTGRFLNPGTVIGIYGIGESIVRGIMSTHSGNQHAEPIASAPFKLAFYPLEVMLNRREATLNKKGSYCRVEIKLRDKPKKTKKDKVNDFINMFDYFSKLAEIQLPEEAEDNLLWSTENHNNYGKKFESELEPTIKKLEQKPNFEKSIDRPNQKYNLYTIQDIEDYKKYNILACFKNERYILSFVSDKNLKDGIKKSNEILSSNKPLTEKIKEISEKLGNIYTHLSKYENGKLTETYEYIS